MSQNKSPKVQILKFDKVFTLQGTNISYFGKRKTIFRSPLVAPLEGKLIGVTIETTTSEENTIFPTFSDE